MLRVRPEVVGATLVPYVRYECKVCGRAGGLARTGEEAAVRWDRKCRAEIMASRRQQ